MDNLSIASLTSLTGTQRLEKSSAVWLRRTKPPLIVLLTQPGKHYEAPGAACIELCGEASTGRGGSYLPLENGFGQNSAGEFLASHPDVDAITFTGESSTGTAIMKSSAASLKELSFELGGKNAAIVFDDADFDKAVSGVAKSAFINCGQVCLCTERVYVHRSIFDKFVAALKEKAESIDGSGSCLGEYLVPARSSHALRRFKNVRCRQRRRPALTAFLLATHQRLYRAFTITEMTMIEMLSANRLPAPRFGYSLTVKAGASSRRPGNSRDESCCIQTSGKQEMTT